MADKKIRTDNSSRNRVRRIEREIKKVEKKLSKLLSRYENGIKRWKQGNKGLKEERKFNKIQGIVPNSKRHQQLKAHLESLQGLV